MYQTFRKKYVSFRNILLIVLA